ncbi:hypothetical protein CAPTEDRAFT_223760 [Capitella teleta]|uniref:LRP2-binding protein n=1 Tax=Capitella teleta TaxID=283909 RepID=R7THG8_CAPTE|nr:hypothetical protein CAPTEDRAFT_223760 [Capitella teleta]|eukprot:ELT91021.1 hypothetical protein CAPTEDRAFT_223760 [Capitella teleta]
MQLARQISGEQLPFRRRLTTQNESSEHLAKSLHLNKRQVEEMEDDELTEKLETVLLEKIHNGDRQALFQLGQLYFELGKYEKARTFFERAAENDDYQAIFQLGVIYYDGLHGHSDCAKALGYMQRIIEADPKKVDHLTHAACYNIGRAYLQGYGCKQSDELAEKFWLIAADDGNPNASIKAQSALGLFYSREDHLDLKKAFYWHSEACGNNNLESQGALGVMYQNGLGVKQDASAAFVCLREAASRGNVYAMGNLVSHYYKRKFYTKCMELAARVAMFDDVDQIAKETDCLPCFISKGISMAAFYYARCLHLGLGVQKNEAEAKKYYSRSFEFDSDVCAKLQNITQHGII